jgi:hypothetical protein
MNFELISTIIEVEPIAIAGRIREIARLRKSHGAGRWRKLKGKASVRVDDGSCWRAEIHWYEANGIGRKEMKIKCLLSRES